MTPSLQPKKVLLVMDIQNKITAFLPDPEPILNNIALAIAAARKAGIPVVYVTISFRANYAEVNMANKRIGQMIKDGISFTQKDEGMAIHPIVAPQAEDIIVVKKRVSAFSGSDLEIILRVMKAEQLILTGFATSGVVLSTLREAADKDFEQIVISDACADRDPEVHTILTTKVFPGQATVLTAKEWIDTLQG